MKITDVEVIPLRIPQHNIHIADGIQDDVIVRVHTDEGISGVGESDSSPMVIKAIVEAWPSWPRSRGFQWRGLLPGGAPVRLAFGAPIKVTPGDENATIAELRSSLEALFRKIRAPRHSG